MCSGYYLSNKNLKSFKNKSINFCPKYATDKLTVKLVVKILKY